MNKLKLILAAVLLSVTTTFTFANGTNPTADLATTNSELRSEISDIINKIDLENLGINQDEKVTIEFIVTEDSKILVTKTSNTKLDGTIKYLLNYKTVSTDNIKKNEKYIVPVVLKK